MTAARTGLPALVYHGIVIAERDDFLCLTHMWRASGADPSKRPVDWVRQDGAQQFIDYIADRLKVSQDHLFQTEQGRNGATWAHWQLGMAYAKYLDHEFHAWCNQVVRTHMESRHLPIQAVQGAVMLSGSDLERFAEKIGEGAVKAVGEFLVEGVKRTVEPRFDRVEARLDVIEDRIAAKRARPNKETLRTHNWANHELGGRCPCCGINTVCNSDGTRALKTHFDHFTQVDNPRLEASWIVCGDCNQKRLPKARSECRSAFDSYQRRLQELLEWAQGPLLALLEKRKRDGC